MNTIKVACFGMQGFGNNLLQSLQDNNEVTITALYTRASKFDFAYYECETLESVAQKMGVPLFYITDKGDWECEPADLAIVSSFHRIFKKKQLSKYPYIINIHSAYLPNYKGATPTNWMIKNGEKIVGLSAHFIDEGIDTGRILFQQKLLNPYLTDNQLRKVLAFFSKQIINDIIASYPNYLPISPPDQTSGSFFPKRTEADALLNIEDIENIEQLIFHIKAFTNFPMPKLKIANKIFVIDYENPKETVEIMVKNQNFSIVGYWN